MCAVGAVIRVFAGGFGVCVCVSVCMAPVVGATAEERGGLVEEADAALLLRACLLFYSLVVVVAVVVAGRIDT